MNKKALIQRGRHGGIGNGVHHGAGADLGLHADKLPKRGSAFHHRSGSRTSTAISGRPEDGHFTTGHDYEAGRPSAAEKQSEPPWRGGTPAVGL